MSITLKIISYQRLTPGEQDSFQTDQEKFSIGRSADNDWTLPDPQRFMSGKHCWLENRGGTWTITDSSTNGVFINGSDERMEKNSSLELSPGDKIRMGDYELEVELGAAQASAEPAGDFSSSPFGSDLGVDLDAGLGDDLDDDLDDLDGFDGPGASPFDDAPAAGNSGDDKDVNTPLSQMDDGLVGDSISLDDLYGLGDEVEEPEPPPSLASLGDSGDSLRQSYSTQDVEKQATAKERSDYAYEFDDLDDDWDVETEIGRKAVVLPQEEPKAGARAPKAPKSKPAAPAAPRPMGGGSSGVSSGTALSAFAEGAGVDAFKLNITNEEEFFRELGELIFTMTEGVMQAIASRSQIKSEFRLEQTMIAPVKNNPFKFSVSAEEALVRLLDKTNKAYQSGSSAAAEAIDDINAHQLAVMAGTEAALRGILGRLLPDTLESKFSSSSVLGKALPIIQRARCWDFYKVLYDEVSEAADDDFQQLFGAEFSDAYQKQLDRLKSARKDSTK